MSPTSDAEKSLRCQLTNQRVLDSNNNFTNWWQESKRDVQNFDADFTESAPELSPVDEATLARIDQKQFNKFPYTNPDIHIFESF